MKTLAEMNDVEIWRASLTRARNMGEVDEVARLRAFVHAEMMADRVDPATTDKIGHLVDAVSGLFRTRVKDVIGPNATRIPWDVLAFVDRQGDSWHRAFGPERYDDDGEGAGDGYLWDWVAYGGRSTDTGALEQAPLTVTRVVTVPGEADRVTPPVPDVVTSRVTLVREEHGTIAAFIGKHRIGAVWGPAADSSGEWFSALSEVVTPTGPDGEAERHTTGHRGRCASRTTALLAVLNGLGFKLDAP